LYAWRGVLVSHSGDETPVGWPALRSTSYSHNFKPLIHVALLYFLHRHSGEAIAPGYQIGNIIFPSPMPVVIWAVFSRPFIVSVLRSRPEHPDQPSMTQAPRYDDTSFQV